MDEEECGYSANFIEDVPDYLKCMVCMLVLRDPVMFVECGHKLCQGCFQSMNKHARNSTLRCPMDRELVNKKKVFEDKAISRAVLDLKVKCNLYTDGCQWTGELRDMKNHLRQDCSFEGKKKTLELLQELEERVQACETSMIDKNLEDSMYRIRNEEAIRKFEMSIEDMKIVMHYIQNQLEESQQQLQETMRELALLKDNCNLRDLKVEQLNQMASIISIEDIPTPLDKLMVKDDNDMNAETSNEATQYDFYDYVREEFMLPFETHQEMQEDNEDNDGNHQGMHDNNEDKQANNFMQQINRFCNEPRQNECDKMFKRCGHLSSKEECTQVAEEELTKITEQVNCLPDHIGTMKEVTTQKETVFQWTLLDYISHKAMGDIVFSPTFSSPVNGHCCRLWVTWWNDETGLDLTFELCGADKIELKRKPFRSNVKLEIGNRESAIKEFKIIPANLINDSSIYIFKNFLNMLNLDDFVINDSLFITCTLSAE